MKISVSPSHTEDVVKEAFWLAWQACGGPMGMGFLQDRSGVTKDDVWNNIVNHGDYPGSRRAKHGDPSADYVFGRMMKLHIEFDDKAGVITVSDSMPHWDYQAWCGKYKTYQELIVAAMESVLGKQTSAA